LIHRLAPDSETGEPTMTHKLASSPKVHEISVNALSSWKNLLQKLVHGEDGKDEPDENASEGDVISYAIASRKPDIHALWTDPSIRTILKKKKLRIEDLPGL